MSSIPCREFRDRLERALRGRPEQAETQALVWHEHLLGCASCRALLETEEALEELLASLPAPRLPDHLATRVLACLVAHRAGGADNHTERASNGLDRLLDLDRAPATPPNLAPRILAGLSSARTSQPGDECLDALLDRVPAPEVPAGLSARTIAALESARRPVVRFRFLAGGGARKIATAAAVLVLGFLAWRVFIGNAETPDEPSPEAPADAELIAALDVLQRWDLLMSEDPNLQYASISPLEETLFEAVEFEDPEVIDPGSDEEEG